VFGESTSPEVGAAILDSKSLRVSR
jgi:hypothetical protein